MLSLKSELTDFLKNAFEKSGYDRDFGVVTISDRPDLCQFQCNGAMSAAKQLKKNPFSIATDVLENLNENDKKIFKIVEIVKPGFINLTLNDDFLKKHIEKMISSKDLGLIPECEKKTIVIDYGGPNVAKPLHIGHLRTAIIGESIKRLAKALGHNVIGDIHLGDWGLQMGLVFASINESMPDLNYFSKDFKDGDKGDKIEITIQDLNIIYPEASARSKIDDQFKIKAYEFTSRLQNKEDGIYALWKKLLAMSINDMKKSYDKLNVFFDVWYGESDADPFIPNMTQRLEEKNLMYESDGAMVVDVNEDDDKTPIPPVIIKKTDGSNLYATTDLATIIQRVNEFNPDCIWYIVDNRQSLHFKQVFRCAKKAGFVKDNTELSFEGFGTMNGKDGKPFKTREGGVMHLCDLIETMEKGALERVKSSSNKDIDEDEQKEISDKIAIAALKFGDLINHRTKDYCFDIDKFLSFEGKTGPYLLYTVVRINSLLNKAKVKNINVLSSDKIILPPSNDSSKELMLKLSMVSDSLLTAFNEKAPNVVCECAYDLCCAFNKFYFENKILSENDEKQRNSHLTLIEYTKKVLTKLFDILGFEAPAKM